MEQNKHNKMSNSFMALVQSEVKMGLTLVFQSEFRDIFWTCKNASFQLGRLFLSLNPDPQPGSLLSFLLLNDSEILKEASSNFVSIVLFLAQTCFLLATRIPETHSKLHNWIFNVTATTVLYWSVLSHRSFIIWKFVLICISTIIKPRFNISI